MMGEVSYFAEVEYICSYLSTRDAVLDIAQI